MYYVYILQSKKDGQIYTGFTSNLKQRCRQHFLGKVRPTKGRRPLVLVYYQAFLSEADARREEKYLKSGGQAKTLLKTRLKESLSF